MELNRCIEITDRMYSLVNFPISIIDSNHHTIYCKPSQVKSFFPKSASQYMFEKYEEASITDTVPYIFVNEDGIYIGLIPLDNSNYILIGPVLSQNVSIRNIADKYSKLLSREELSTMRSVALSCQMTDHVLLSNVLSTFYELIYNQPLSVDDILKENFFKDQTPVSIQTSFDNPPVSYSAINYHSFENDLISAIESGNLKELETLWSSPIYIVLDRIPSSFNHPIFTGLPFLSIMRYAAISGGADIDEAFSTYDAFLDILMKKKTSADSFITVTEASYAFCKLVDKKLTLGQTSLYIKKCVQYIHSHIGDKITISDLAIVCGQSSRQVSRFFASYYGMGVTEFINSERIRIAKEMLSSTNTKIVEIGNSLGFSSQSHFTKAFSQRTGITPREYRNRTKQL